MACPRAAEATTTWILLSVFGEASLRGGATPVKTFDGDEDQLPQTWKAWKRA